jgi:hypothetical protein
LNSLNGKIFCNIIEIIIVEKRIIKFLIRNENMNEIIHKKLLKTYWIKRRGQLRSLIVFIRILIVLVIV